ncbi:MAG: hypothetical protein HY744_32780, partial [Deltaproteobacteria bacterium]|nr:hypothetical protein [Deltaproteobacteria bacterium]
MRPVTRLAAKAARILLPALLTACTLDTEALGPGVPGPQGPAGDAGVNGEKGDQGDAGPPGDAGVSGKDGTPCDAGALTDHESRLVALEAALADHASRLAALDAAACPRGSDWKASVDGSALVCTRSFKGASDVVVKVGDFWLDRYEASLCGAGDVGDKRGFSATAAACSAPGAGPGDSPPKNAGELL